MSTAFAGPLRESSPLELLWERMAQPVNPWAASEALLGMSNGAAQLLAAILLLASSEAEALFAAMPSLSRSLSIQTVGRSEQTSGELRGPILWSETIAARSASAGNPHAFVYTRADRAYDTSENRILVSALRALVRAGRTVDTGALRERDSDLARLVNTRSMLAHRWLEHRPFSGVADRIAPRDRQRTRAGNKHRQYQVAIDLLDRHAVPLAPEDLALVVDPSTQAQLTAVSALVEGASGRGINLPHLVVHNGAVEGGPILFIHRRSRRARAEGRSGLHLAGRPVDVSADVAGRMVEVEATPPGAGHLRYDGPASVAALFGAAGL